MTKQLQLPVWNDSHVVVSKDTATISPSLLEISHYQITLALTHVTPASTHESTRILFPHIEGRIYQDLDISQSRLEVLPPSVAEPTLSAILRCPLLFNSNCNMECATARHLKRRMRKHFQLYTTAQPQIVHILSCAYQFVNQYGQVNGKPRCYPRFQVVLVISASLQTLLGFLSTCFVRAFRVYHLHTNMCCM